ncbi:MAG: recombinase RecT, partial [Flavobacteriales bacterium]|nr:recombinase RecT [Flavobacteriales bacterium]
MGIHDKDDKKTPVTTEQAAAKVQTIESLFKGDEIQKRFNDMLGKKSAGFISSVIQITRNNKLLAKANPESIMNAAAMAAALDLPINHNLGLAWIVPYGNEAQFQLGWKGFVQLALRTGKYEKINVIEVYENQFKSFDALSEDLDCNFKVKGKGKVVGYAAYLELKEGFKKTVYWDKEEVEAH